ncbi:MAG: acyltransferase [Nitrosomonadales bacterium]
MNPTDILPAIICVSLAILTIFALTHLIQMETASVANRFASIDGLRGFLAFCVFLHHACIWYFYLNTGAWAAPPSSLYAYFGTGSVMLFFMVTAFLFSSKLIEGKTKGIDWCKLFTSRLLRIVPLYLFAVLLVFLIVVFMTHGELKVSPFTLINNMLKWLRFWSPGMPPLNGVGDTSLIVAAVFWTLPFEWGFYFSLPLLAIMLSIRPRPPIQYLALTLLGIHILMKDWHQLIPFASGIATAYLHRIESVRNFASRKISSALIILFLSLAVIYFPNPREAGAQILLFGTFVLIACGNDLFGILTNKLSRILGEMSYSVYLLHGMVLFVTFNFVIGIAAAKNLTSEQFWLAIFCLCPVLIVICHTTYRTIEHPFILKTARLTAWFHGFSKNKPQ